MKRDITYRMFLFAAITTLGLAGCADKNIAPTESHPLNKPPGPVTYHVEITKLGDVPLRMGRIEGSEDGLHAAIMVVAEEPPDEGKGAEEKKTEIGGDERWQLSVDGVRGPKFVDIDQLSIQFSPDGKHCAYFAKSEDLKTVLMLDQKPQPQSGKYSGGIYFSDDGKHLAFTVADPGVETLIVDGRELLHEERIENLIFSPDGKRIAFVAYRKEKQRYVVTGGDEPDFYAVQGAKFSPDGKRFAYVARDFAGKKEMYYVVSDGRKSGPYASAKELEYSADGRHFGYVAQRGDKALLVIDGKEREVDGEILWHGPIGESPPRMICTKRKGKQFALVIDGHEERPFDLINNIFFVATGDGKHYVYIGETGEKKVVMHDGRASSEYEQDALWTYSLCMSRDGTRAAYVVNGIGGSTVIVEGREIPFADAAKPVFSPDGKRVAYIAEKNGLDNWRLVVDGVASKVSATRLYSSDPLFSPDSQHIVCITTHHVLLDDVAGPNFEDIIYPGPTFHPDGTLEYLIIEKDVLYRVKHVPTRE